MVLFIKKNLAYNDEYGLSIIIYKAVEEQLQRDGQGQLAMLYESYALCPDEELSESEKQLKYKILNNIEV